MLELRPICENCAKSLPANSEEARICSFECTFCADCVETVLHNVCPNCGGGFERRPVRPQQDWRNGNSIQANIRLGKCSGIARLIVLRMTCFPLSCDEYRPPSASCPLHVALA